MQVCGFDVTKELNELHCVGPGNFCGALHKAMNLNSVRCAPKVAIAAATEFHVLTKFSSVRVECSAVECTVESGRCLCCWYCHLLSMCGLLTAGVIAW